MFLFSDCSTNEKVGEDTKSELIIIQVDLKYLLLFSPINIKGIASHTTTRRKKTVKKLLLSNVTILKLKDVSGIKF